MFSQTADYALRAAACLALHPDEPVSATRIAELTSVPGDYLSKVLQQLSRRGIITSRRGLNGGYQLARPASKLSIMDVINAVDPPRELQPCSAERRGRNPRACVLHGRLQNAQSIVGEMLSRSTIQMVVDERSDKQGLCVATMH